MTVFTGLPPTWKTWKIHRIKNLFKKSRKSQGIYQENGQVREMSRNLKASTCQTSQCIFNLG